MKLLKTGAMLLMGLLIADCMAAPDLATVHGNGIIEVKTGSYELSFFPGCMFPFRLKTGGKTLPEPVWLDRIVGMDGKQYYLNIDRFAERRIVTCTEREFCVEMSGTYCLNDDVSVPGKVLALYRYGCRPDGIEVDVRISNPEGVRWKEVHVLTPGWKTSFPASSCTVDGRTAVPDAAGFFGGSESAGILFPGGEWRLSGKSIRGYDNRDRRFWGYLSGFRQQDWDGSELKIPAIRMTFFRAQP